MERDIHQVNLCPTHLQESLVQAIASRRIERDNVSYGRKLNKIRMDKLISEKSATIVNRQQILESKVHMPLSIVAYSLIQFSSLCKQDG